MYFSNWFAPRFVEIAPSWRGVIAVEKIVEKKTENMVCVRVFLTTFTR